MVKPLTQFMKLSIAELFLDLEDKVPLEWEVNDGLRKSNN
jgi:hypothetical protein